MKQLTDHVDHEVIPSIREIVNRVEGVLEATDIRARRMGAHTMVDLKIRTESKISASAAHKVAEQVSWCIMFML